MNQPATQFAQQPQFVVLPAQQSNGLGVAGFFIALIGLFVPTGIVALLGLLISLVALGRAPRAFAAMGVFVGLLGTAIWAAVMIAVVLGAVGVGVAILVAIALGFFMINPEVIEFTRDTVDVGLAVTEYEDEQGVLPANLAILGLSVPTLTDPWGRPYRFELSEECDLGFDLTSSGTDGQFGTTDDLAMSRIDDVWEQAFESFGPKMEKLSARFERMSQRAGNGGFNYGQHARAEATEHDRAEIYEQAALAAAAARETAAKAHSHKASHHDASSHEDVAEPQEPADTESPGGDPTGSR